MQILFLLLSFIAFPSLSSASVCSDLVTSESAAVKVVVDKTFREFRESAKQWSDTEVFRRLHERVPMFPSRSRHPKSVRVEMEVRGIPRWFGGPVYAEAQAVQDANLSGEHAIYVGAGIDILRLIYTFPDVKHYHLFDIVDYWSQRRKQDWIDENELQLIALTQGNLKVTERGFLDFVPSDILLQSHFDPLKWKIRPFFAEALKTHPEYSSPLVYELELTGESGAKIYKTVSLHPFDFLNEELWHTQFAKIPTSEGIAGLLWGPSTTLPDNPAILQVVGKLLRERNSAFLYGGYLEERGGGEIAPSVSCSTANGQRCSKDLNWLANAIGASKQPVKVSAPYGRFAVEEATAIFKF